MAVFDPETKKFFCECGCGEECRPWNRLKWGHNFKLEEFQKLAYAGRCGRKKESLTYSSELDEDLFVECKLCGLQYQILGRHLVGVHGIDSYQYKLIFPGAPTASPRYYRVHSENQEKEYAENPGHADKISEAMSGYVRTREHQEKINAGRARAYENTDYAQKISEAQIKLWEGPEYAKAVLEAQRRKPNKVESFLRDRLGRYFPGEWKYTGDGDIWIGRRNPDFTNINGRKAVIELFGTRFHWREGEEERKVEHYRQYGFKCVVIWADDTLDIIADWPDIVKKLKEATI